jgi:hypothetical protein
MKLPIQISRPCRRALALALVTGLAGLTGYSVPAYTGEGTAKGGAAKLIQLSPIKTVADAQAAEPGDTVVMSCPKCKNSWAVIVPEPFKSGAAAEAKGVVRHECPGCTAKIVTAGHGKTKTQKLVHVCKNCGSDNGFCCMMKKSQTEPTLGIDKQ